MSGKYTKNTKKRLIQNIQSGRGDLPTVIKIPKQYYGVITKSLGISSGDQTISNMPNPPQTIFEAGDYIPIVRNGQNYKLPLSSVSGIIQSLNFLTTSNMLLKSGNAATLQITDDGLGNIVFTVIGGAGGGFDPTQNIIFSGTDSFTKALTVPAPTLPGHAVNVQYLESAKWADANNFGTNPTTGLTTLTNIQTGNTTINPLVGSYISLIPLNCSGASVRLNLYLNWTGNQIELELTVLRNTITLNSYQVVTGSINTIVLFNTLFAFYFDVNGYIALKSLTAITGLNVVVRYVSDTPTPVANIPLIGTIYSPTSASVMANPWASTLGVTGYTMMTDPTTGYLRNGSVYSADHSWTSSPTSPAIAANSYILLAALNWNTLSAGCIINFGENDYLSNGEFSLHINFQGGVTPNATVLSFNSNSGSVLGTYANFLANWSIQYVIDGPDNCILVYLVNKNDVFPASATAQSVISKLDILAMSGIPASLLPLIGSIVDAPPSPTTLKLTSSSAVNIDGATLGVNPTSGLTQGLVGGYNTGAVIPSLANPSYVLLNPAVTDIGGYAVLLINDGAGDCYINFAIGGVYANIINYQGGGAYVTLAAFQAAYKFYKDTSNYLYIQPTGTVTNFSCRVYNGFAPLSLSEIPNIGTVQTCSTPRLVVFSQLTTTEETQAMQSTIDSLTARLEALESPKTPLKAAKK